MGKCLRVGEGGAVCVCVCVCARARAPLTAIQQTRAHRSMAEGLTAVYATATAVRASAERRELATAAAWGDDEDDADVEEGGTRLLVCISYLYTIYHI